jgi:signal transduction histidine kinase/tetratricopeptide (TPR) repeat protein
VTRATGEPAATPVTPLDGGDLRTWLQAVRANAERVAAQTTGLVGDEGPLCGLERGVALLTLARFDEAIPLLSGAVESARRMGASETELVGLNELSKAHAVMGDLPGALEISGPAIALAQRLGERRLEGTLVGNVGMIHGFLDQPEPYAEFTLRALEIGLEIGDERLIAHSHVNLGGAFSRLRAFERAQQHYDAAAPRVRALAWREGEALVLAGLGGIHGEQGRITECERLKVASNELLIELGNYHQVARHLQLLGFICLRNGALERAVVHLEAALDLARARKFHGILADSAEGLSQAYERLENPRAALSAARTAAEARGVHLDERAAERLRMLQHTHHLEASRRDAEHARSKAVALTEANRTIEEALQRIQRQEADLRTLLDALPSPLWVQGPDGPRWMNRAARETFRRPAPSLAPLTDQEMGGLPVEVRRRLRFEAARLLPVHEPEVCIRLVEGEEQSFELRTVSIDFEGQPAVAYAMHDLTERKRLEAQLHHLDRIAALGTLAAGIAHEVNNPLAYLMANLKFVVDELEGTVLPSGDDRLRALRDALDGADRMRTIVRGLKTFAAPNTRPGDVSSMARVLATAADIARTSFREGIVTEVEVEGDLEVVGDEPRLVQVFVNLLVNAGLALAETPTPRVVVRARSEDAERVLVTVTDNGKGISPDHLGRIFDPFFTTRTVGEGTGLGLSICQGIVRPFGGRLSVESAVGQGTTFTVALTRSLKGPRTGSV